MKPTAITKCEIGQDWYKHELEIYFVPGEAYPDYIEVEAWIMNFIDGQTMNIEDVVDKVYQHIEKTYKPQQLCVKSFVTGNKVHFDVIVEK